MRDREGVGAFLSSSEGSLPPGTTGPLDSVCLSSPKQAVVSSQPNFWPHSLQIQCNGLGPKTVTLQIYFNCWRLSNIVESYFVNHDLGILCQSDKPLKLRVLQFEVLTLLFKII